MKNLFSALALLLILSSCNNEVKVNSESTKQDTDTLSKSETKATESKPVSTKMADAATILARKQVPILCYHHIRDVDQLKKNTAGYDVTLKQFKEHMKALHDSGYHSVLPEQLYQYLAFGTPLPENPVMITYDDTDLEQFTFGKTEMDKYGFKGVYFIMTISIGRPNYMSTEQIKQLSDEGHSVQCHTWDHHRTDRYISGDRTIMVGNKPKTFNDWDVQLGKTKSKIEEITGKPVEYFAYPFGVWSSSGIPEIQKRGYKMAFQLSSKRDSLQPLYTVRRIIVAPEWSTPGLLRVMRTSFK